MSHVALILHKHAIRLLLGAVLFGPLMGCSSLQTLNTSQWFDPGWIDGRTEQPVNHLLTMWDNRVRITEDTVNGGAPLHGMAGRLFLFNEDTSVEAHGRVVVQMLDLTNPVPGQQPNKLGEWSIPAENLKQLKRKLRAVLSGIGWPAVPTGRCRSCRCRWRWRSAGRRD